MTIIINIIIIIIITFKIIFFLYYCYFKFWHRRLATNTFLKKKVLLYN